MIHNRGYGIRTYGPPQMAPPPTSAPLRLCTLRYLWRARNLPDRNKACLGAPVKLINYFRCSALEMEEKE